MKKSLDSVLSVFEILFDNGLVKSKKEFNIKYLNRAYAYLSMVAGTERLNVSIGALSCLRKNVALLKDTPNIRKAKVIIENTIDDRLN